MRLLLVDDEATLHGEYLVDVRGPDAGHGYVVLDIGDGYYHDLVDLERDIMNLHFNQGVK